VAFAANGGLAAPPSQPKHLDTHSPRTLAPHETSLRGIVTSDEWKCSTESCSVLEVSSERPVCPVLLILRALLPPSGGAIG